MANFLSAQRPWHSVPMLEPEIIYLDHNATAPLAPEAAEAMSPWLTPRAANPSSPHRPGRRARAAVEDARRVVGDFLAAEPGNIVFTSGGTEADNLAIGGAFGCPPRGHLIVAAVEHPAVLEPAAALEAAGVAVTRLGVDAAGLVDLEELDLAFRPDTRMVSVMAANHEVGTEQPVDVISGLARAHGVIFHCDAVQAAPWQDLGALTAIADLVSISAHKLAGPVGVGALFVREGLPLRPQLRGGAQQAGRRGGTEPVALISGFAAACKRVERLIEDSAPRVKSLRDSLENALLERVPDVFRNGSPDCRLPNTSHLSFASCDGNALVARLDLEGVAAASGAACSTGVPEPSHVLTAMGIAPALRAGALRISLGYETSQEEVDRAITIICESVEALRRAGVESVS
jgi:cysteine desulfurase